MYVTRQFCSYVNTTEERRSSQQVPGIIYVHLAYKIHLRVVHFAIHKEVVIGESVLHISATSHLMRRCLIPICLKPVIKNTIRLH